MELKVSQGQAGTTPIVEETCWQCRRKRALLDLETHGRRAGWHEFHWNPIGRILDAKTVCRVTEADIDFVNGLDANVVIDCHDRTFVALSNDTVVVVFDNLISRRAVSFESDQAVFLGLCRS